jgi:hypothetical protein
MSKLSYERIPNAGLEFLLTRILTPRATIDDALWHVRRLYGDAQLSPQDWIEVRERVARMLVKLRGHVPARSVRRESRTLD